MKQVVIAGGGIGGLSLALTLHQIGVPFVVIEASAEMRPLGVGINLQPNAVRELFEMGLGARDLDQAGVPAKEWALLGRNGREIHAEPRGSDAGYHWPQYAVHRGAFHMLLYRMVVARAGEGAVRTGLRVLDYRQDDDGVVVRVEGKGGVEEINGALLVGADGIHSAIRAQMYPDQPPINWGGALMWRGTTRMKPLRTGSSFVGLGSHSHRMVIYPISPVDPRDGTAQINWIAEVTVDARAGWQKAGWFREAGKDTVLPHFEGWEFGWLNVPDLIRGADVVYENPMIDRDPVSTWVDGRVALLGDAAHAMYPTGSNGASQAVIDGRVLGAMLVAHGVGPEALNAYDEQLCEPVSALVLRNRGAGPFGLLNMVDERCGGEFDDIDAVIPAAERADFMAKYKAAAGFARDALNAAPPTISKGARVSA